MVGEITLYEILKGHSFLAGLPESPARPPVTARPGSELPGGRRDLVGGAAFQTFLLVAERQRVRGGLRAGVRHLRAGPRLGNAFGWSALLDHHDTLFQVRARESSTALRLDRSEEHTSELQSPMYL